MPDYQWREEYEILTSEMRSALDARTVLLADSVQPLEYTPPELVSPSPCRCAACRPYACADCSRVLITPYAIIVDGGYRLCSDCVTEHPSLYRCCECTRYYESAAVFACGEPHCSSCCTADDDDDDDDDDGDWYDGEVDSAPGRVFDYGYRPDPVFHGTGTVYLGMELEVEIAYGHMSEAAELACRHLGELGYLKEDGSINSGFEIVTHPMTHEYAAESFPWGMLSDLENVGAEGGDDVGIHVHVSRAGFDGPAHVYRWLKLIYRNSEEVSAIARRYSEEWAPFSRSDRRSAKDYAKGDRSARRYAAVNVTNYKTFEVRVFASSLNVREVRAALDLVAGSVEYTRHLTVREINDGGWTWHNFINWAEEQGDAYAALVAESEALI